MYTIWLVLKLSLQTMKIMNSPGTYPTFLSACLICPQGKHWSFSVTWISLHLLGFPDSSVGRESACSAGHPSSIPGSESSPGEGKGYPLQYSGLENSMVYIFHGVAKSQTRLSDLHFTLHKGFSVVNEEVDAFWNSLAFSMIQQMLAFWSLVRLPFLNLACASGSSRFTYCWSLVWRILSITLLACESATVH